MSERRDLTRPGFLAAISAAIATLDPGTVRAQTQQPMPPAAESSGALPGKLRRSLVLSGGGALGAYEAGAISALVDAARVGEGVPLPQYGVICGTSIGALNAYLVATAQWQRLSELWATIASQRVIRLKPEFAKLVDHSAGVANRLAQAIGLAIGVFHDVKGVIDGDHLHAWLTEYMDVSRPVVTPVVWATTNLSREFVEYFYVIPERFDSVKRDVALKAVRASVGPGIAVREVERGMLITALQASAAVPVAFDPIVMPGPDGTANQYVDGGVTDNTPLGIARAMSSAVDTIILAPPFKGTVHKDALGVAIGSFDTVQRALMRNALQRAYLETLLLQTLQNDLTAEWLAGFAGRHGYDVEALREFAKLLSDTDFLVLQPREPLPITLFGFSDAEAIAKTYDTGKADAAIGFKRYAFIES